MDTAYKGGFDACTEILWPEIERLNLERIKDLTEHPTYKLSKELEQKLEIAIEALKFECGDRCSDINPCNAKEALTQIKEQYEQNN
jgi:hypothetical protein